MSDSELSSQTDMFRKRLKNGETEEDIMVEAFAVCREATRRCLGMFHYEVQLASAVAMQDNCISEMKTGEGKTLVQILVAYLNALSGKGVHVMTSNDYLTERDCEENSKVYEFLGLSCGFVPENRTRKITREEKQKLYSCDIVYAKASTVGFDYLNFNLDKFYKIEASRVFKERLDYIYKLFEEDISYPSLRIRKMTSKWGVCNITRKIVTLNLELIKLDIKYLDYVIVHELSHLIYPNHSKDFWNLCYCA